MRDRRQTVRKAAILVSSLDAESAQALLSQMPSRQAAAVRKAITVLGAVDPSEQNEIIEEFFRVGPLVPDKNRAGIDLNSRLARQLSTSGSSFVRETENDAERRPQSPPFRFLHEA